MTLLSKNQYQPENRQPCIKIKLFIATLEARKTVLSFISSKTLFVSTLYLFLARETVIYDIS